MGVGSSAGLAAGIDGASEAELCNVLKDLSATHREKLAAALAAADAAKIAGLWEYKKLGSRLPEVQAQWDGIMPMWDGMMAGGGFTMEVVQQTRQFVGMMDQTSGEFLEQCNIEEMLVDGTLYGSETNQMKVLVMIPKKMLNEKSRSAQIWFHGGAFVAGSAEAFKKSAAKRAVNNKTVLIAPEIGVAPETKAPHWYKNGYAAIKWVHAEAAKLGIDTARVALSGESAGAYTGLGVCMELAKKNESELAKVFVSDIGAFNNDFLMCDKPEDEAEEMHQKCSKLHMQTMAYLIADEVKEFDWTPYKTDPNIFPAQMDEALLPKLPPIVLMTREFDHVGRRGNEQFAERLKPHGKLLGLYIQPGTGHGLGTAESNNQLAQDEALIFASFLHK